MVIRHGLALWAMARPLIMVSVVLVYGYGLLIARAQGLVLEIEKVGWGLVALLFVAVSTHYINEYADVETDALTARTLYSGGSGVLPRGEVSRRFALQAGWVSLGVGWGVGLVGFGLGVLNGVALGCLVVGGVGGWLYSVWPLKLAWQGWGELTNAVLGGWVLPIYGYSVVSGEITLAVVLICVPFMLLVFNNLLATTWADRVADGQVGKFTLATRYGPKLLRQLYGGVALAAFGLLVGLGGWVLPGAVVGVSFLALPMVVWGWRTYTKAENPYPTSNAMVVLLVGQMVVWWVVG